MDQTRLVGTWRKITVSRCSRVYPDDLRFDGNGLLFGRQETAGAFALWDAGTFEVAGPGTIRISTANDAVVAYAAVLRDDVLTFTDPDGCEFSYRRA